MTEKLKSWLIIPHKETRKDHKLCRNDLHAFELRNYSEGYKRNKPLSGLLVYRRIMPSAERLPSKFHSCPRSFASRPTVNFSDNLSAVGITCRLGSLFLHPLPSELNVCILGYTKKLVYACFHICFNKLAVLLSFTVIYRRRHIQLLKEANSQKYYTRGTGYVSRDLCIA